MLSLKVTRWAMPYNKVLVQEKIKLMFSYSLEVRKRIGATITDVTLPLNTYTIKYLRFQRAHESILI